jgi:hypothetical protein
MRYANSVPEPNAQENAHISRNALFHWLSLQIVRTITVLTGLLKTVMR